MSKSLPSYVAPSTPAKRFNYNKLQAVLCIAASAAVSVAGLYLIAQLVL